MKAEELLINFTGNEIDGKMFLNLHKLNGKIVNFIGIKNMNHVYECEGGASIIKNRYGQVLHICDTGKGTNFIRNILK